MNELDVGEKNKKNKLMRANFNHYCRHHNNCIIRVFQVSMNQT